MEKLSIMKVGIIIISTMLIFTPIISAQIQSYSFVNNTENKMEIFEREIKPLSIIKHILSSKPTDHSSLLSLFTSTIHTTYEDTEKTSEITFGLYNDIDVDNDNNTGVDGKDIRVQYLLLPYILLEPEIRIGLIYSLSITRIADEIKHSAFSLTAELGDNLMYLGYQTPEKLGNEIPSQISLSSTLYLKLDDNTIGFSFAVSPEYDTSLAQHILLLYARMIDEEVERTFSFTYEPAISSEINIIQTGNEKRQSRF